MIAYAYTQLSRLDNKNDRSASLTNASENGQYPTAYPLFPPSSSAIAQACISNFLACHQADENHPRNIPEQDPIAIAA